MERNLPKAHFIAWLSFAGTASGAFIVVVLVFSVVVVGSSGPRFVVVFVLRVEVEVDCDSVVTGIAVVVISSVESAGANVVVSYFDPLSSLIVSVLFTSTL